MNAAYNEVTEGVFLASALTRGPWHPDHQHAGPPSALICRAVERAAANHGLTHLARLTVNLLRPAPIGECQVDVAADYVGRSTGHFSGRLTAKGKDIARFTALMQREEDLPIPEGTALHPPPQAPKPPGECPIATIPFPGNGLRLPRPRGEPGRGRKILRGALCCVVSNKSPLVKDETPSAYQRVAVAADSGNGTSASLDFSKYLFLNCDLTINLFRRPEGEWVCLDARSFFGGNGCGLAESALYDERGLIGRGTQSLTIRQR